MKAPSKLTKRLNRKIRIRAIVSGTAERPRLTVYRSLNHNFAQLIDDTKGVTLVSASDIKDKNSKKPKSERAKEVGLKIAELAAEKKITTCVFDRNGYKYHGSVKAMAEGAREGGLKF